MSVQRRGWRFAAAAGVVLLTTGCSIGDIRRPVPTRPPTSASPTPAASPRPPVGPDEVRQARVEVPAEYRRDKIVFTDAEHGYVTFVCNPGRDDGSSSRACPPILMSTSDGGRSWQQLRHPRPNAADQQPLVAEREHLVLRAGPDWFVSADHGKTFTRQPASAGLPAVLRPRFQLCCDPTPQLQVEEWVKGRYRPLPAQPPVPGLSALVFLERQLTRFDGTTAVTDVAVWLWAAGIRDGRPYAAVSRDGGKTWQPMAVPAPDGGPVRLRLERSSSGDVWLVASSDDLDAFPYLWREMGDQWEPVAAEGHPKRISGLAPLDNQMVAVTGPNGSGVVAGGYYNDLGWPLGGNYVQVLDDGTLFSVHPDGSVWLGEGYRVERRWIKIVFLRL